MIYDVIIAGAGPVGLLLAAELRLAGSRVLVLEAAEDPRSPLKDLPFGLRGLSVPTLEAFDRRGLLDDLVSQTADTAPRRNGGHFAGIPFGDAVDTTAWSYRLPSPADEVVATDMTTIETVLTARAVAAGAEIRRGHRVEGVSCADDVVTVRIGGGTHRAHWLAGCDGGRSAVRKLGGFEFAGTEPRFTGYSVHVVLDDPAALPLGRTYTPTGMYVQAEPGVIAMVDFDGGAFHRTEPVTPDRVQAVLRRVSGSEVAVRELRLATTWTDRAQQATTYRRGRILLAGDAAHVHAPLGGQGLNLGLGDAMNLGWRLAAVRDGAPVDLLDGYTRERHPVGAAVLGWSRAQATLLDPDPRSRALEPIIRDLIGTRDGATYFADRVWGATLRHGLPGSHPLIGRSAPDFHFTDGTRLAERLRGGTGALLDFGKNPALRAVPTGPRISYLDRPVEDALGLSAVLVRPDGVVAWACDCDPDPADVQRATAPWQPA